MRWECGMTKCLTSPPLFLWVRLTRTCPKMSWLTMRRRGASYWRRRAQLRLFSGSHFSGSCPILERTLVPLMKTSATLSRTVSQPKSSRHWILFESSGTTRFIRARLIFVMILLWRTLSSICSTSLYRTESLALVQSRACSRVFPQQRARRWSGAIVDVSI